MLAFLLPAMCAADETCPWLNAATADGVLGGSVTTSVTHPNKTPEDAICEFVRRQGTLLYSLRIDVQTMSAPKSQFASFKAQCGTRVEALRAIGNEAVACSHEPDKERTSEQVIGRVRDRAFLVRLSTTDSSLPRDAIREKARSVAEQVAGILF